GNGEEQPTPVTLPDGVPESREYARWGWSNVTQERIHQDGKWGVSPNLHPQLWLPVLAEEFGEVAKAILQGGLVNYREEVVQVAAVALAMLQDWDWQQAHRTKLPPPQVVAAAWERAQREGLLELTGAGERAATLSEYQALRDISRLVSLEMSYRRWAVSVRWVGQEDASGCGIACCAMLSGLTYRDVAA